MLYDISVRLKFVNESDSDEVWAKLKTYLKDKDIKSLVNEESFIKYHLCGHDEGKECTPIEMFTK